MIYNYSVIIPFRDKYELFVKAVKSIPDRKDIQIILVDNALQPLPKEKIPEKQLANVSYFTSSPTKGAGCARNIGLQHVNGNYIIFLDADDFFTPNAFISFDKYLEKAFDIVFFQADSISLIDGSKSTRHIPINKLITSYFRDGNEDWLRYRFFNPIAKMFRASFVLNNNFLFDEIKVSNDVWFSIMTGHMANKITADEAVVYMITIGDVGSSLTRTKSKENWFIRYQVMVKVNQFLKTIGKYQYRIRLIGALRIAWIEFGFMTFLKFVDYARKNKVSIF